MISRFKKFISENSLFIKSDRLILALSGGIDSVALFHLLRLSGFDFEVAHVNYSLRGKDSDEDEQFAKTLCEVYGIEFHSKKVTPEYWKSKYLNIQNEARKIRYAFFNELDKNKSGKILTAHQLDDNLETVLMNFTRGTGIKGMMGIIVSNNNIVRPILNFTREDLESFLIENKFAWRDDKSNASLKYKRNRFRHKVIPFLKEENPALLKAFENYREQLNPVYNYYLTGFENFKKQNLVQGKEILKLTWKTEEELGLFLFPIIYEFGFNQTQSNDIKAAIDKPGRIFNSKTHFITVDRNCVFIRKNKEEPPAFIQLQMATKQINEPIALRCSIFENKTIQNDSAIGQFDLEKLQFPLTLRKWQQGDKIKPLGMKGSKKISDILIDNKIPLHEKENVFVLESNNEIIWLIGKVISDNFKITSKTKEVFRIELN
jgi:tRNA(Ile)-lysidine synthase